MHKVILKYNIRLPPEAIGFGRSGGLQDPRRGRQAQPHLIGYLALALSFVPQTAHPVTRLGRRNKLFFFFNTRLSIPLLELPHEYVNTE
jgi:hypothetical protein